MQYYIKHLLYSKSLELLLALTAKLMVPLEINEDLDCYLVVCLTCF